MAFVRDNLLFANKSEQSKNPAEFYSSDDVDYNWQTEQLEKAFYKPFSFSWAVSSVG